MDLDLQSKYQSHDLFFFFSGLVDQLTMSSQMLQYCVLWLKSAGDQCLPHSALHLIRVMTGLLQLNACEAFGMSFMLQQLWVCIRKEMHLSIPWPSSQISIAQEI